MGEPKKKLRRAQIFGQSWMRIFCTVVSDSRVLCAHIPSPCVLEREISHKGTLCAWQCASAFISETIPTAGHSPFSLIKHEETDSALGHMKSKRQGNGISLPLHLYTFQLLVWSVTQSWPTLCNPWTVAHRAPLSMEFSWQKYWNWVAISFSRGSSRPRNQIHEPLNHWALLSPALVGTF